MQLLITDASFQNFHISASVKGVSLPSTTTAYVLGNSNIKLDLNLNTDICIIGGGFTGLWTAIKIK